jgi:hypothetical protein
MQIGQELGVRPVRRGAAPVEQAGVGERERARAEAHEARAAGVGGAQGLDQLGGGHALGLPRREDDRVGLGEVLEAVGRRDREAAAGLDRAAVHRAGEEAVPGVDELAAVEAEHLTRHPELEGCGSIHDGGGDGVLRARHGASMAATMR